MADLSLSVLQKLGQRYNVPILETQYASTHPSSFGQPITNSYYGINYMQTPLPVPMNKDHYGYVFFTRPQLNLQTPNLEKDPRFSDYLSTVPTSVFRAIRCYLDPRLQWMGSEIDKAGQPMGLECPLVDAQNPFICLLTNHAVSVSGFQDVITPKYVSAEGQYRETHVMVDGSTHVWGNNTISATFRNSRYNPIIRLLDIWVNYPALVFEGIMVPYADYILAGMMDYFTRIYRFTLDPSKRYVTGSACTGASFPSNIPKGQQYDYNVDKPYNDATNQVSVQFESVGNFYDDPRTIDDFNTLVGAFNPSMKGTHRYSRMEQIPVHLGAVFNCRAYPYIDPDTKEMQWYVSKDYYSSLENEAKSIFRQMLERVTDISDIYEEAEYEEERQA